jgi:hypothetical protein
VIRQEKGKGNIKKVETKKLKTEKGKGKEERKRDK